MSQDLQQHISLQLMSARDHESVSFFFPYRYEVRTKLGMLHYFGSRHFFTPDSHLFIKICELVNLIRPELVVVEHFQELHREIDPDTRARFLSSIASLSESEAVAAHGESGLAVNLAAKIGAAVECPEPRDRERFEFLASRGYAPEQIASYYVTRAMSMFPLWSDRYTPTQLVEHRIERLRIDWPWDPNLLDAAEVNAFLERCFGVSLFDADPAYLSALVHPTRIETDIRFCVLNAIGAAACNFTDTKIVQRLYELSHLYESILVIFGASHALRQEAALKKLLFEARP